MENTNAIIETIDKMRNKNITFDDISQFRESSQLKNNLDNRGPLSFIENNITPSNRNLTNNLKDNLSSIIQYQSEMTTLAYFLENNEKNRMELILYFLENRVENIDELSKSQNLWMKILDEETKKEQEEWGNGTLGPTMVASVREALYFERANYLEKYLYDILNIDNT